MNDKTPTPGELIKATRDAKGLSAYALGLAVDCTPQHIYQVEHGKTSLSVKLAKRIAEILDIDWTQLV